MIDPIHSLAFSIQANPGVYAVLLGSGVSRSAKIPTGWEITLDLVRKLAAISDGLGDISPQEWYQQKFQCEPNYSSLLDNLAKSQTERQQLLRSYFDLNDTDKEERAKQPTQAHRSIAKLVSKGFIKVIITTNFDRLMEMALNDEGINPVIISTEDQLNGALPLIHTQCCVLKVNGDYMDARIRNTPEELAVYSSEFESLLARIFDEFGLIVCGWSAEWDEALCKAITRSPSRRFAHYWAVFGKPSNNAQQLIEHRSAQVISIKGADSFFDKLQSQVQSLEEFSRPHHLSTSAAVTSLKRYLSESKYRLQLDDLVTTEVGRILELMASDKFALKTPISPDAQILISGFAIMKLYVKLY